MGRCSLSEESWDLRKGGVKSLDLEAFATVQGFAIALRPAASLGEHLEYRDGAGTRLAGFPWWDHVSALLKRRPPYYRACGPREDPFTDMEHGWEQLAFETGGFVYVLEGNGDGIFPVHFRVASERFTAEWARVISEAKQRHQSCDNLPEALEHPEEVRTLDLASRPREIPDSVSSLVGLEHFRCTLGTFTALPQSLATLSRLRYLLLPMNQLEALPEGLGQLRALEVLDLTGNKLTEVPKSLHALPRLQHLHLSGNRIRELPPWLETMPALKSFDAAENPLSPESAARLQRVREKLSA